MSSILERKLQRFVRLSDADRLWLAEAVRETRHVPARSDVAVEGDDPRAVIVVLDGWAGRCRTFEDGRRQIVSLLLPGDCCDPHVFLLGRRDHTITALAPVVASSIPGPAFTGLETRSPALERAFHLETLAASAIQREVAASLGRRTAVERLAHLFCELQARLAALGLADDDGCPLPLSQEDLADVLGLTSVHVNRVLRQLRERRLIGLRDRRLTIHDADGLARLAQFDPVYLHALHTARKADRS